VAKSKNDVLLASILQASFLALPGTTIVHFDKQFYDSFIDGYQNANGPLKQMADLRRESNAVKYGNAKYQNNFKTCDFVELMRYFDAETTYAFYFDLNGDLCANNSSTYNLESSLLRSQTYNLKFIDTQYSPNVDMVSGKNEIKSVKFNSKGVTSTKLPKNSFLVLSQDYMPPDIKEIF
jgi:hypothetical protein